ncbi:MAG: DegQ family serine endoprotease [Dissulfurimicrobium sp.]|uniref:DegQ family serine endoprotease n=1 Tax=Dissulfurimicrobium TaxID=1769732 RepID=UPI003C78EEC0
MDLKRRLKSQNAPVIISICIALVLSLGVWATSHCAFSSSDIRGTASEVHNTVQPAVGQDITTLARLGKAFASIAKSAIPAVVSVQVEKTLKQEQITEEDPFGFFNDPFFRRFFGPEGPMFGNPHKFRQMGLGSGFIISQDGYILTNNHVVSGADVIKVKLYDGREFKAKVIGTDPQSDIAVIKIPATNLPVLKLGDSDKIEVGEWAIAIGNPFGLKETVTVGVISAKGRDRVGISDYEDFIQTDAAINPGNSGGPLLNIYGEVIGINTAIFSKSGGYMGIGFAIPINMAKVIKDQLIAKGKITRGWLGVVIQDVTEDLAKSFGLKKKEGVLVADVTNGSPAEKAGIKREDVIIELNGVKINDSGELRNKIALTAPGTVVKLEIERNGKRLSIPVTIAEQPQGIAASLTQPKLLERLGFTVQDITPEIAEQLGYKRGQGVVISDVEYGSIAAQVGLRPGMLIEEVNRQRVHNVVEFNKALLKQNKMVLLRIRYGQISQYITLSLE